MRVSLVKPDVAAEPVADKPKAQPPGPWRRARGYVVMVVAALVGAMLIQAFLVQSFYIPSGSMERTLHGCPGCHADRIIINKVVYRFHPPRHGDIVVFSGKGTNFPAEVPSEGGGNLLARGFAGISHSLGLTSSGTDFVKRVIGVGGDTVACPAVPGRPGYCAHVTVNGRALNESRYVYQDDNRVFGPVTVPAGYLFLMGDHRSDSSDSRDNGVVPVSNVIGRAELIIWPLGRIRTL